MAQQKIQKGEHWRLDLNALNDVAYIELEPIDSLVTIQSFGLDGTLATAVATVVFSNNGADWVEQATTINSDGLTSPIDVSSHRYVGVRTTTAEGSALTIELVFRTAIHPFTPARSFALSSAFGGVPGISTINKFGEATDCDNGVATDIWDGADGTTSTDVWVAPTTARLHDLASTSANDTSAGSGMQTCQVYGLTSWGAAEVSEVVTLAGASNATTANSYVIIHRIKGLTFGAGFTNAGIITATAQTDGTVTAAIQTGEGQTLMCIYGVPSTQDIYLTAFRGDILKQTAADADVTLLVKENANLSTAGFITKDRVQIEDGAPIYRSYDPYKKFTGPCIVKLQAEASIINSEVTGGFDGYLVDK